MSYLPPLLKTLPGLPAALRRTPGPSPCPNGRSISEPGLPRSVLVYSSHAGFPLHADHSKVAVFSLSGFLNFATTDWHRTRYFFDVGAVLMHCRTFSSILAHDPLDDSTILPVSRGNQKSPDIVKWRMVVKRWNQPGREPLLHGEGDFMHHPKQATPFGPVNPFNAAAHLPGKLFSMELLCGFFFTVRAICNPVSYLVFTMHCLRFILL